MNISSLEWLTAGRSGGQKRISKKGNFLETVIDHIVAKTAGIEFPAQLPLRLAVDQKVQIRLCLEDWARR